MTTLRTEQDILQVISHDRWMMHILRIVRRLHLPDWWVAAGFVRNKIWDVLHDYKKRTLLNDVDVIYFDKNYLGEKYEMQIQRKLRKIDRTVRWSVTNQARMARLNGDQPYRSSSDGLAHWTETPTCIGVTLSDHGQLHLTAPHGMRDLLHLIVRPGPYVLHRIALYHQRMREKNWKQQWPKLTILEN